MNTEKYFDKFNIMIIGDEKVGKTSILERYNLFFILILDIFIKLTQMIESRHLE